MKVTNPKAEDGFQREAVSPKRESKAVIPRTAEIFLLSPSQELIVGRELGIGTAKLLNVLNRVRNVQPLFFPHRMRPKWDVPAQDNSGGDDQERLHLSRVIIVKLTRAARPSCAASSDRGERG
jgi:hypothetical protein